jgi:hypothetical protein
MHCPRVWLAACSFGPVSADAKVLSQPGSPETQRDFVSPQPGWLRASGTCKLHVWESRHTRVLPNQTPSLCWSTEQKWEPNKRKETQLHDLSLGEGRQGCVDTSHAELVMEPITPWLNMFFFHTTDWMYSNRKKKDVITSVGKLWLVNYLVEQDAYHVLQWVVKHGCFIAEFCIYSIGHMVKGSKHSLPLDCVNRM